MGSAVADREKRPSARKPDAKAKYDASVKLRAEFKEQLEAVAEELNLYPGELIEDRLGVFIRAEWKRILQEKLKRVQDT